MKPKKRRKKSNLKLKCGKPYYWALVNSEGKLIGSRSGQVGIFTKKHLSEGFYNPSRFGKLTPIKVKITQEG